MELTIPDCVILTVTAAAAVVGLFIGVSGALSFLAGSVAASVSAYFVWPYSSQFVSATWLRGIGVGVVALFAFGIARWLVGKLVHGLVAQPGDAIFGSVLSAVSAALVSLGIVWALGAVFPDNPEVSSVIMEKVLVLIGR